MLKYKGGFKNSTMNSQGKNSENSWIVEFLDASLYLSIHKFNQKANGLEFHQLLRSFEIF